MALNTDPASSTDKPRTFLPPAVKIAIYFLSFGGGVLAVLLLRRQGVDLGMLFAVVMGAWLVVEGISRIPGLPRHMGRAWALGIAVGSALMVME